jgi:glycerol-3-phosphate acyltransferase PlsX
VDCDAKELVGFAHLGAVYARDVLGRAEPAVGLLNVGEEDEKGNAVVKEAHQLLKAAHGFRYAGNVEGADIPAATCRGVLDVVVRGLIRGQRRLFDGRRRVFIGMMRREVPTCCSA